MPEFLILEELVRWNANQRSKSNN